MEKPLFWHQGLFMQPQHLQLKDIYDQSLLTPYNKYGQPHLWGVGKLEIRETALPNFIFHINEGEFWFPDMTFATLSENATIAPRSFKSVWLEGGKPLIVYIGLKKLDFFNENVTIVPHIDSITDVNTRFVTSAQPEQMADLHHTGPPADIKRLSLVLKIFFDPEINQLGNYELIPIAQLERRGEDVVISSDFICPCITISGSIQLWEIINEIHDQLASRGRELESYKKQRGIHTAEFGSRDMVYLLALRSLNRYIPLLEHLIEGKTHPWTIFSVLKQLIGELSCFSERISAHGQIEQDAELINKYDHRNLWKCFSEAAYIISQLLDETTAGPEYIIPIEDDGAYYSAILKPEYFEGNNRFYIVFETEEDHKSILEAIKTSVKVGSSTALSNLIQYALPGIDLEYISEPPQSLPRRVHSIYYRIDHHSEHWDQVKKDNSIAVHWNSPPEDIKIELMIVRRK